MTDDQIGPDGIYTGAERQLIKDAVGKKSVRKVAGRMGLSDTRLRQIINGYQPAGRGQKIAVEAPTETLVRIAVGLSISADDLDAAGRPDAAEILRIRESQAEGNASYLDALVDTHATVREMIEWASGLEAESGSPPPTSALFFWSTEQLLDALRERDQGHHEIVRWHVQRYEKLKARLDALLADTPDSAPSKGGLDKADQRAWTAKENRRGQATVRGQQEAGRAESDESGQERRG